jgi:hypothetical protein
LEWICEKWQKYFSEAAQKFRKGIALHPAEVRKLGVHFAEGVPSMSDNDIVSVMFFVNSDPSRSSLQLPNPKLVDSSFLLFLPKFASPTRAKFDGCSHLPVVKFPFAINQLAAF